MNMPFLRHFASTGRPYRALQTSVKFAATISVLVIAVGAFLYQANKAVPMDRWLLWGQLKVVGAALLWGLASLASGRRALQWLLGRESFVEWGFYDRVAIGGALGTLIFALFTFAFGICGWLGDVAFVGVPALCFSLLPWRAVAMEWRLVRNFRLSKAGGSGGSSLLNGLLLSCGVLGLVGLFLPTLSPKHVGYDSAWYHLPIAEHYVAAGKISRFAEGWFQGTQPQLASLHYTWAFALPAPVQDKAILSMQLEFIAFLWTIAGVGTLSRRLGGGLPGRLSWVCFVLFPGIFFYDFVGAADHFTAAYAIPLCLVAWSTFRRPVLGKGVLLGMLAAGALLTKYTSAILVAPVLLAFTLGVAWCAWSGRMTLRRGFAVLIACAATVLLITSVHWLKNWVWYGDPLYPVLHRHLTLTPWHNEASAVFEHWKKEALWGAAPGWVGVLETLREAAIFPFTGYDFPSYTRGIPTNSFLFGALAALLLLTRPKPPISYALGLIYLGAVLWYRIHHNDRYLQALLPIMLSVMAVGLSQTWARVRLARPILLTAVALQLGASASIYFWPNRHVWMQDLYSRMSSTFRGAPVKPTDYFAPWTEIGQALPPSSKVLLHEEHLHLGIQAETVSDWLQWQGLISYGRMRGEADVVTLLGSIGVTHIAWTTQVSKGGDSLASDILFWGVAHRQTEGTRAYAHISLGKLLHRAGANDTDDIVAIAGCEREYRNGFYKRSDLTVQPHVADRQYPSPRAPLPRPVPELTADDLTAVGILVYSPACAGTLQTQLLEPFPLWGRRGDAEVRGRR